MSTESYFYPEKNICKVWELRGCKGLICLYFPQLPPSVTGWSQIWFMHVLQVLASKSPSLLDFHLDLGSLEAASKVYIFLGIEFNHYDQKKRKKPVWLGVLLLMQIQLKSLAEEMQAITKGLEKVKQELIASKSDGPISEIFHKV